MAAPAHRFGRVLTALHWSIAALLPVQIALGVAFHALPHGPERFLLHAVHRTAGLVLLAVVLLFVWRRWRCPGPALPPGLPPWQRRMAALVHGALLAILVMMPLTGWLAVSAWADPGGRGTLIGGIPLPLLPGVSYDLGNFGEQLHKTLLTALVWLLALHVAAALWHARPGSPLAGRLWPFRRR